MWNTLESSDRKGGIHLTSCYTSATGIFETEDVALCFFTYNGEKQPFKNVINFRWWDELFSAKCLFLNTDCEQVLSDLLWTSVL